MSLDSTLPSHSKKLSGIYPALFKGQFSDPSMWQLPLKKKITNQTKKKPTQTSRNRVMKRYCDLKKGHPADQGQPVPTAIYAIQ